jgi:hypothetical protein
MSLTALGADEAHRRAVQISHATATAVRDALHRDSCICHSADLHASITRRVPANYSPAGGGGQL